MNLSFFKKNFITVLKAGAEILLAGYILLNTSFLQVALWQYYRIIQDADLARIVAAPAFEKVSSQTSLRGYNKNENADNRAQTRRDLLSVLKEAVVSSLLLFFLTVPDPNISLTFKQYVYIDRLHFPNCITHFSIPILRAPPFLV